MAESNKSWGGLLFGLIFLLAGLAACYFSAGTMTYGYIKSAEWVEVNAQLVDLELNRHTGDDSTTYSVSGLYSYEYNGVSYTNDRVSLSTGSDNFGSYWQDLYRRLKAERRNGSVRALVNPSNPNDAILDRTLRIYSLIFGAMFGLIFGGIGGFVMWASWRNKSAKALQRQQVYEQGVPSNEKVGFNVLLGFGAVFFLMGAGIGSMAIPEELAKGNYWVLLILIFVLVGLVIMLFALKQKALFKKFGPTPLVLDPQNPSLGGEMGASLLLQPKDQKSIGVDPAVMSTLRCIRRYRSGKNTSSRTVWEDHFPAYVKQGSQGLHISTKFNIPDNGRASKEWSDGDSIDWELAIEGDFSSEGLGKLERSWPIFIDDVAPNQKSGIDIPKSFVEQSQQKLSANAERSVLQQIELVESDRFVDVVSAAGRHLAGTLFGILFGAIFAGVGWFTVGEGWWPGYLFMVIGALVLMACIYSVGSSVSTQIDKHARLIRIKSRWFGLPVGSHECAIFSADQFSLKETMSSTSGKKTTRYYALKFDYNGKNFTLAKSIEGKREAQALKLRLVSMLFD